MRGHARMVLAGLATTVLAGCALPSAMPAPEHPTPRRLAFARRVTLPSFRYDDARETPEATIAGRVLDDSTGLPVRGRAAAWLTERADSSASDAWGQFELAGVAPGRYTLVTWAEGYEPRLDVLDLRASAGAAVEVRLRRAGALSAARALPARGSQVRVIAAGGSGS
ncbi:MAG: carboxypeptidase regulatory-like domain-containing protein [Gemmatimonadetes bacterium]|nr:carboxypeptidase regulatory-like domain-containing protein [Gemmatimonadota bacterium]